MTVSELFLREFAVDLNNAHSTTTNDIRNQFLFSNVDYGPIFDKDISQLEDEDVLLLFVKRYVLPGSGAWQYSDIVRRGREIINRHLPESESH